MRISVYSWSRVRPNAITIGAGTALLLLLTACASPQNRADAQPVFYPNEAYQRLGAQGAANATQLCARSAQAQGLSANNNTTIRRAGEGAAQAGVLAVVGSLVSGRGGDESIKVGAQAATAGAASGAVNGAFDAQYNPVHRQFMQACLSNQGLQVLGWN